MTSRIDIQLARTLSARARTPASVEIEADQLEQAIPALVARHPELRPLLTDKEGRLHGFIGLFLNQKQVTLQRHGSLALAEGDVLAVVPAVAGG